MIFKTASNTRKFSKYLKPASKFGRLQTDICDIVLLRVKLQATATLKNQKNIHDETVDCDCQSEAMGCSCFEKIWKVPQKHSWSSL